MDKKVKAGTVRDAGYLDGILSKLRCRQANRHIPSEYRNGRILDIGCGTHPQFLLKTEFAKKYGIDQVITDQSHLPWQECGIQFSHYDLEKDRSMPFTDQYFDVVTMLAVFEHVDPKALIDQLKEIRRILKSRGIFIMTTPAWWTDGLLKFLATVRAVSPVELEEHKDAYAPSKIINLYQQAGFLEEKIKFGYFEIFMNIWVTATV